jgi:hypothetical protein
MNQDWQEKEIRQLFRNERQANESLTPDFALTLEAALSGTGRARPRRLVLRVAFAAVALVAVGCVVFLVADRSSREQQPPMLVAGPNEPVIKPPATVDEPVSVPPELPAKPVRRPHRHQSSARVPVPLISQWRSPTAFLLKTPGDELLRTVPRLGASAVEININLSSTRN